MNQHISSSKFHVILAGIVSSLLSISLYAEPVISEFLASNDSELADENGDFSDWIEIHNPDATAVNLTGWHLTDNDGNLTKWTFPNVSIPANGYLIVFASSKNRSIAGSELHTNFKLSSSGEYLALVKPDGVTKTSEFNPFPAQNSDVSYGVNSQLSLVNPTSLLRYSLSNPANDAQGRSWTAHDYTDSAWIDTTPNLVSYPSGQVPRAASNPAWSTSTGVNSSSLTVANSSTTGADIKLNFNISRSGSSSLRVDLTSPAGTQITVFNNGPNSTSFSASLSQFNNQNLNGNWTLTIREAGTGFFSSGTSTLQSWSLEMPNGTIAARAGIGYDNAASYLPLINTPVANNTTEAWVRFPFSVSDPTELSALLLRMRYDDGFQAYINGTLVASANITPPIAAGESTAFVDFDLNAHLSALRNGENVLAIRLVNANSTSSDLLLVPELIATNTNLNASNFGYITEPSPGTNNQGGAINSGPIISDTTENPTPPADADSLLITSQIQPREGRTITSATLHYRVNYAAEVMLTMRDDGTNGDAVSGDGIYSAIIPASPAGPGDMLRWKVKSTDSSGQESTDPLVLDTTGNSQSPEYFGTVITDPSISQTIPVMQWFCQNVPASRSTDRIGARASVFYQDKFYDNIFVRQRGGFSNTNSQKFDFNKGHPFFVNSNLPSVGEVNMNANGIDASYVRQPLSFQFHQLSGGPGCDAFPVQMRVNGAFDRVGTLIEQVDEDYLKRFGYDEKDGELFKVVHHDSTSATLTTTAGVERKTGDKSDLAPIQGLINDLNQAASADRINSFYDNMDVQEFINYMAVRCVLQQGDDLRKNFYLYKDATGDERWRLLPWDLDFVYGLGTVHGANLEHPFFGTQQFRSAYDPDEWNRLYNVAFEDVTMQRLYLRRVRSLMDAHMKSTSSGSWFEPQIDTIFNSMAGLAGPSNSNYTALKNTEVPERRNLLYNQYTNSISGMSVVIPSEQTAAPSITITNVDFNPASGDQDQEYIQISNSESTEVDISGWSLSVGVDFVFPAGTVVPRNGVLYVSPNLKKFASRTVSPKAGERALVTGPYQGHLSSFGEQIILKNVTGQTVQTFSYTGAPSLAQQHLVVSQFHYHPTANGNAEFIEISNISNSVTVDLTGVHFTDGVDFTFTGSAITSLAPGERVLIVKDQAAFEAVYGTSVSSRIAGVFANGTELNNSGENVKLEDSTNSTIHEFNYLNSLPWPSGQGTSLVLINPTSRPDHNNPANWRTYLSAEGAPAGASPLFPAWLSSRGQTDPAADPDGDGRSEEETYALGADLAGENFVYSGAVETINVSGVDGTYLTLTSTVRNNASTNLKPQISTNLTTWPDAVIGTDVVIVSQTDNGNGTSTIKYRTISEVTVGAKTFLRLKITQ